MSWWTDAGKVTAGRVMVDRRWEGNRGSGPQPTDMARRQVKVVRAQLTAIRERFQVDSCTHSPRS